MLTIFVWLVSSQGLSHRFLAFKIAACRPPGAAYDSL
jgi:hypothetical protein